MKKRWFIVAGLLVAAFICRIVWIMALPSEPAYGGKSLSAWLDELSGLGSLHSRTQGTAQIQAVRAIGTNAIPWLIEDYRHRARVWKWRLNQLLKKQKLVNYRLRDANDRPYRATVGFRALGEMAEPAIPELLALVEACPGYVPGALAGIGRPAVPALQQCLTNMTLYTNSLGSYAIIPGNTISEIYNATSFGPFSKSDIEIFLPAIEGWARQTTNQIAQAKAQWFLNNYGQLQ